MSLFQSVCRSLKWNITFMVYWKKILQVINVTMPPALSKITTNVITYFHVKVKLDLAMTGIYFYTTQRGKHIVAALSVRPSVRPVLCPANNFNTTVGI